MLASTVLPANARDSSVALVGDVATAPIGAASSVAWKSPPWDVGSPAENPPPLVAPPGRTAEGWTAQKWLWSNSSLPSVQACRRSCHGMTATVELSAAGTAHVGGLRTCGSATSCALCSASTWADRAEELTHILRTAHTRKLQAVFVTLTMRHKSGHALPDLWDALSPALTATTGEGSWKVRKWRRDHGDVGMVRRVECTHGAAGWHLHAHLLLFVEGEPTSATLGELRLALSEAWQKALPADYMPSEERGVRVSLLDISQAEQAAADYVTTAGSFGSSLRLVEQSKRAAVELTDASTAGKTARHGNRTTWEVLRDAVAGDGPSAAIWSEWEQGSKGRQVWRVTPYLRELADEHPEQVQAEQEAPAVLVTLSELEWQTVCRVHDPAELLDAAEAAYGAAIRGGEERGAALTDAALTVLDYLADWGVRSPP